MDAPTQGAADVDGRVILDSGQKVADSASANPRRSELACTHGSRGRGMRRRAGCRGLERGSDLVFGHGCLVRRLCRWHILQLARSVSGRLCTCLCCFSGGGIGRRFTRRNCCPGCPHSIAVFPACDCRHCRNVRHRRASSEWRSPGTAQHGVVRCARRVTAPPLGRTSLNATADRRRECTSAARRCSRPSRCRRIAARSCRRRPCRRTRSRGRAPARWRCA